MTENKQQKTAKEHISTILPFQIIEKVLDKPLKIRGIAMTAGISRNYNFYTPEELEAFSSKLSGAPVYIEHVSVDNAVGKVTKTEWDGQRLWYEAEIYEGDVAEKIRKGLVQHVSVGADYEAVDIVDGKIPHGLCNAELSLVAVPGIPETNISVLESLAHGDERKVVKVGSCVFCSSQAHYLISSCKTCYEKLSTTGVGVLKGNAHEALNEKDDALKKIVAEAVQKGNVDLKATIEKLSATEGKLAINEKTLAETAKELADCQNILTETNKTIELLRNKKPSPELFKDPPRTLPIPEAITILESLLPSPAVEHSTLGMQRECQTIRQAIHNLNARLT